jgi:glycosyltransferase involved in cell wall biosynthesis
VVKLVEYLANLAVQSVRMGIAPPAVLHVQFLPLVQRALPFELWALRWAKLAGVKIVYTVHNVLPHDSSTALRRIYTIIYTELADALIAHDEMAGLRLRREFGVPSSKIHIIPHGPLFGGRSPERSLRERDRLGISPATCLVVCQGILRPYKGVPFLLEAWKLVVQQQPSAILRIAGTGDDAVVNELRRITKELGLEKSVILDLRFLSVPEVEDCLDSADVLVYPYREVTTSGALLTGVNYAKAVVATRQPAFAELLDDGRNALLVDYGDTATFAQTLLRLIHSPALRTQLGESLAQADFRAISWTHIAEQTSSCYKSICNGSPST